MRRIRRLPLVVLNVITLFFGISIAGVGIWIAAYENVTCLQFLDSPIICFGVLITAISVLGLVSVYLKNHLLFRVYMIFVLLLFLSCAIFSIFSFVVTHKNAASSLVTVNRFSEHLVNDFSEWLQNRVEDPIIWMSIRTCLASSIMCSYSNKSSAEFGASIVKTLAADTYEECCFPLDVCGFTEVNGDYINPTNANANADCTTYNNDMTQRCFDCDACPAGVLQSLVLNWKRLTIVVAFVAGILIILYCVGCQYL
ncbi:hypothetical protein KP509_19G019800 [Ceratopteris richardii]|uniref:Uncharacterized protein n=1 Tax=Ceratopteris richardii TaxID=49495 RepID=A0A8T2SJ89_CERRI|nr:hypothetical protein KP509_19G019800 [Ceratopteris richardii]